MRVRWRDDDGTATLEFVGVSVVLFVPVLYAVLSVFTVQRASFGATQAAREAGRVLVTADDLATGLERARRAAALALSDQGVATPPELAVVPVSGSCTGATGTSAATLAAGSRFRVCVTEQVPLPYLDKGLLRHLPTRVRVTAGTVVSVDRFRAAP